MAFIEVLSGAFDSDLVSDADGFVLECSQLGRRLAGQALAGIRSEGPGSARPH
jgi:hypothetical protein